MLQNHSDAEFAFPVVARSIPSESVVGEGDGGLGTIGSLITPSIVINEKALSQNIEVMAKWATTHGVILRPHGKTTMAPQIWARQLASGANGIAVANSGQLKVAVAAGVPSIEIANEVVDPAGIREICLALEGGADVSCWVDSVEAVNSLEDGLELWGVDHALKVLLDMGGAGGRTGARSSLQARAVAEACSGAPKLALSGVAGYEGALASDRSEAALTRIRDYVKEILRLHTSLIPLYDAGTPTVSIGGSVYFDVVAEAFNECRRSDTLYEIRSGAYVIHDSVHYEKLSPLSVTNSRRDPRQLLTAAVHGYATVISRPEPKLVILNGGRRDFPYDLDLPIPLAYFRDSREREVADWRINNFNDQHAFMTVGSEDDIQVGDLVMLGLSHPCTMMDKWSWIPLTNGWDPSSHILSIVRTYF